MPSLSTTFHRNPVTTTAEDTYFSDLISREFGRLAAEGHHYLDYTGGGLYAESQIQEHFARLLGGVFGNPHSTNPTSIRATELAEEARNKVLNFFNAGDDYFCIFTGNASAALKIVGECFPWSSNSEYLLLTDNHNSVNGIREYCKNGGGSFRYAPVNGDDLTIDEDALSELLAEPASGPRLFAYPAQSNVSGVKHNLDWVARARVQGWSTLLDAAAFAPTSRLDLSTVQPDFAVMSFYKMFGYPTGIGCLLVRKPAFNLLQKRWFAGGNVRIAGVCVPEHFLAEDHERFENGTINYLDLPAITTGLNFLESVGMERLNHRVSNLINYAYDKLSGLNHSNGSPLLRIYGPADRSNCGGTLIMSVLDANGNRVCFREVEKRASDRQVSVRSGCFCNPGLDEVNSKVSVEELKETFGAIGKMGGGEILARLSGIRGATRVSVGIASTKADLDAFVEVVESFRD